MRKIVYSFGFPRLYKFIIYCSLIAIFGFITYFFKGNTDLTSPDSYNDEYSVMIDEEFESMIYLSMD